MRKRSKMSRSKSKSNFRKTASRVHPKNGAGGGMRGGIRL